MKLAQNALPTPHAMSICETVNIIPDDCPRWKRPQLERNGSQIYAKWENIIERLIQFQQLSLVCDFDDAMIAWHSIELDDIQKNALRIIHKTTQPWLVGHVVGELLSMLKTEQFGNGKDAVAAADMILNNLVKDGVVSEEAASKLVVNVYGQNGKEEIKNGTN